MGIFPPPAHLEEFDFSFWFHQDSPEIWRGGGTVTNTEQDHCKCPTDIGWKWWSNSSKYLEVLPWILNCPRGIPRHKRSKRERKGELTGLGDTLSALCQVWWVLWKEEAGQRRSVIRPGSESWLCHCDLRLPVAPPPMSCAIPDKCPNFSEPRLSQSGKEDTNIYFIVPSLA